MLLERATDVFAAEDSTLDPPVDVKVLHPKIGGLTLKNVFLKLRSPSVSAERKPMIDASTFFSHPTGDGLSDQSLHGLFPPKPICEYDQGLLTRMDRLHRDWPFVGASMLRDFLCQEGFTAVRKHVGALMRRMGLEALYKKPRTTQRHPAHQVYP